MKKQRILLTGASGFFGQTIYQTLAVDADMQTLGRSKRNTIQVDLATEIPHVTQAPDLVIHAAGKAHSIPKSRKEVEDFFHVNYQGSINLLTGLERSGSIPSRLVFISTAAVYGKEHGDNIDEESPLLGNTPYAQSKIQAETYWKEWCITNNVALTILRLPLLVGRGAPGNLGQMIQMMKRGLYFGVGKGAARRSMVLAEDVAQIIPMASENGGIFNLTDGVHSTLFEFEQALAAALQVSIPKRIPWGIANTLATMGDWLGKFPVNSDKLIKLTSSLTFSDTKARAAIGWNPRSVIKNLDRIL